MTKMMDEAIDALRDLSPELQDKIAPTVLMLVGKDQPIYQLTPEEEADLAASEEEARRGQFATDEEMRAIWTKHGLTSHATCGRDSLSLRHLLSSG